MKGNNVYGRLKLKTSWSHFQCSISMRTSRPMPLNHDVRKNIMWIVTVKPTSKSFIPFLGLGFFLISSSYVKASTQSLVTCVPCRMLAPFLVVLTLGAWIVESHYLRKCYICDPCVTCNCHFRNHQCYIGGLGAGMQGMIKLLVHITRPSQ
uniref:Uncharacterized protein n=1 Tax=Arundo donax TaxID=35708 RepID=A0A0A8ZR41_ARUDO